MNVSIYTPDTLADWEIAPAHTEKNLIPASGLAPLEFTREVLKKLGVSRKSTIAAWYKLYAEKNARYFYALLNSLKEKQ